MDSDVDEEETESTDDVVDVEERSRNVVRPDLLILEATCFYDESLHCNSTLALVEEMALQGTLWHEVGRCQADKHREEAFEEKDVSPGVDDHSRCTPRRNAGETEMYQYYADETDLKRLTRSQEDHQRRQP